MSATNPTLVPFNWHFKPDEVPEIRLKKDERAILKFLESDGFSPWRVCDLAFGSLKAILEKRGEITKYDPAYGQEGGEPSQKDRDRCIAALKPFLIKAGYLDETKATTGKAADTFPPPATTPRPDMVIGIPKDDELEPAPPAAPPDEMPPPQSGINWFLWLAVGIVVLVVIVAAASKRRGKGL